jgi:hypothetical protein
MASHWSATGLTVSGVEATIMMSTFSLRIRSPATWAALLVSDWLSFMRNLIGCLLPSPQSQPSATTSSQRSKQ